MSWSSRDSRCTRILKGMHTPRCRPYILASRAVSWLSKLQPSVAACLTEAEYLGLLHTSKEAIHILQLLSELAQGSGKLNELLVTIKVPMPSCAICSSTFRRLHLAPSPNEVLCPHASAVARSTVTFNATPSLALQQFSLCLESRCVGPLKHFSPYNVVPTAVHSHCLESSPE